ncbi:hypothetical protein OG948_22930 [Embleya sp. NBC_00888]|uniref:hypothetical protein n=1 Tax=Embleya sp. NBC_00888 TaxID=2975960 RepID=UPI00386D2937|nr:hypothetical protein OG948_22930 [Embleya sp. NBC_00888]
MSSVLRTVLAATSLGAAAAFGIAGSATAAPVVPDEISRTDVPAAGQGTAAATGAVLGVVERAQLNPMNGGGLNPLSNSVGTDVGDMPVGTSLVTGDLADGMTVQEALDRL